MPLHFHCVYFVRMKPIGQLPKKTIGQDQTVLTISLLLNGSKTGTAYIGEYVQTLISMKEGWMHFPAVTRSLGLIAGKFLD